MENEAFDGLTLLELALRGRWNVAAARAARFPQELAMANEDGLTALHLAAVNSPPTHLFAAVLQVERSCVKKACLASDNSGMTPLLCAAALFAPLETIQALVDACPDAVSVKDRFGATCLHHICSRARGGFSTLRRALARAEVLLEVDPSLSRAQDDIGVTPMHILCEEFETDINTYWLSNEPDVQLGMLRFDVSGLWLFVDTLLRHAEYTKTGNSLHNIVCMPSPSLALVTFACVRSQGAQATEQNDDGDTPLHLAVRRQLFDVAALLVRRFPECASILNANEESALQLATRCFPSFNDCLFLIATACPRFVQDVAQDDKLYANLFENLLRSPGERGASAVFDILRRRPRMVGQGK